MAKILIVDDDPDVLETIQLIFEKEGYKTATATNAEDGLKAVDVFQPDLLVLDVMMEQPDSGFAMAQELRRRGATFKIILLTSISRVTGLPYDKDEAMVQVDAFLEKPIHPSNLIAKVTELLAKEK
jgi:DNA-binding response OmpR family regulator